MMTNSTNNSTFAIYSDDDTVSEMDLTETTRISGVDLNKALILSADQEMLLSSNGGSFDGDDGCMPKHINQTKNRSSLFEFSDNTTFMSLPPINRLNRKNRKFTSNLMENSTNLHNSREEISNKHVPLSEQLRRIFNAILEKHAVSSRIGNSLLDINLQNEKSDELDVHNDDPVYVMAEANNSSLQDTSQEESRSISF